MELLVFLLIILIELPRRFLRIVQEFCHIQVTEDILVPLSNVVVTNILKTNLYTIFSKKSLMEYPSYILDTSKLSTKYRNVTTLNGYSFDVAKSAIQKYIRRGMVKEAQEIVCEMDIYRYVPDAKASMTNFVNRLRIIMLEDIGIASPHEILKMAEMSEKWLSTTDLSIDLIKMVRLMAQVPHSRYYSHVKFYYEYKVKPEPKKPKMILSLGNNEFMRKNVDSLVWCLENKNDEAIFWILEILKDDQKLLSKIDNSTDTGFLVFYILDKVIQKKTDLIVKTISLCKKWYKIMKMKERFLLCVHPTYVYILENTYREHTQPNINTEDLTPYKTPLLNMKPEIPDYVIDMHTHKGRSMGRDRCEFGVEGAFVVYDTHTNDKYADFYLQSKIDHGSIKNESDEFTLKARAQVVCSASRPDTYFAKNKLGQNVVVKGPFLDRKEIVKIMDIISILRLFENVNIFDCNIKLLKPDIFQGDQVSTLGTRTKVNSTNCCYFLVMQDILNLDIYPTMIKNTKVWKDAIVVDFDKVFIDKNLGYGFASTMSEEARYSFLVQIGIRYVFRMGDFAYRNFIRVGNLVYNLDIDDVDVGESIRFNKEEREIMLNILDENYDRFLSLLESWKNNNLAWYLIDYSSLGKSMKDIAMKNLDKLIENPRMLFSKK